MSLLNSASTTRPPHGQTYDKHAHYRLIMDTGVELPLQELYVQETEHEHSVYLRISSEVVLATEVLRSIVGRIRCRANKHTSRLRLEPLRRKYTLEEINNSFLYILVSDKQNMHVSLAPGKQLHGCYRTVALGGVTEATPVDLSELGVISRFDRCI